MKLNIASIDCVCGAMLYPPPEVSDVGEQYYVEELVNPDDATVQNRVSELSAKAAYVETTTETATVGQTQIKIVRITAQRYMAELKPDGLYCPKCGRKVLDIA